MIRIHPNFYDKFTGIANRCPITCCQEWKIAVDADTNGGWKKLMRPETVVEQKKNLSAYTGKKDGARVILLDENHRCPFLAEDKLCRLVSAYGDQVLSETCTVFPREVHQFENHEEATLMPCCPAVIDLWSEQERVEFPEIPNDILFKIRGNMIRLLQQENKLIDEALLQCFYILLELHKGTPDDATVTEYFYRETLEQLGQAVAEVALPTLDTMEECNELLQDLAVNYREEGLYQPYLDPVITLAEQISEEYDQLEMAEKWAAFQKQLSQYEPLFRKFLANEFFSDLVMPEGSLEQMVVQLQWIAMEYTTIRQSLFLKWMLDGCGELAYETVRDYIVVITRMTGYEEEDIVEYLQNSFESLVWDWGYFALIVSFIKNI